MNEDEYTLPKGEYIVLKNDGAERQLINRDLFYELTDEAKVVLRIIFNCAGELSDIFLTKKPTKERLRRYLKLIDWSPTTIRQTIQELNTFTRRTATKEYGFRKITTKSHKQKDRFDKECLKLQDSIERFYGLMQHNKQK